MNYGVKEIEEIDTKIKELKQRKEEIKAEVKEKRGTNKTNILRRMSTKFFAQMDFIDKDREKYGLDPLSLPEKTELVIRHKNWMSIRDDITYFNKQIEVNGGITNVAQN